MTVTRLLAAVALLLAPRAATGQSAPIRLDSTIRAEVVDRIAAALERTYVEADTGRMIAEVVRRRHAAGAYDRLESAGQFAEAVTRDLRSLNGDLHLGVRYSADGAAPAMGSPPDAASRNFGMGRAEILDGNVGYVEITGFMGAPGYHEAVVDALRFVSRAAALIIDVRRNGGGSGAMSHLVFSHFLGAEPVPTIRVKRRDGEPVVRHSVAEVPGPRRPDVPLYVLTSQGTGSAAEEFTFVLQNHSRATVVGSRTAGAGHMVTGVPVGHGFAVSVSITRVMDPATGREWEGTGVIPDLAVDPADALAAAHEAALRKIRETANDRSRASLDLVLETVRAARAGLQPDGPSERWIGTYEGRVVTAREGRLLYARREGALAEPLVALGGSRFGLGELRLAFERAGGGARLTITRPDGTTLVLSRDP